MAHTPGPWHYGAYLGGSYAVDKVGPQGDREAHIADCHGLNALDNARRIVAAVNACHGVPTEALENGRLKEVLDAAAAVVRLGDVMDATQRMTDLEDALRWLYEEAPS